MHRVLREGLAVALLAGVVVFTNLGGSRLWDRDEPRNSDCAKTMADRGDWVTPVFNGQLRTAKPVLLYWLIMSAYAVFGVSEFSARFWSAALAVGSALITYGIGRRLFNGQAALWSAMILSTSLMFDVAGRAATPDSVLIFFVTAALGLFVLGAFPKGGVAADCQPPDRFFRRAWPGPVLMYALMGAAVLGKGPVGLVLPTAIIGMFLLLQRLPAFVGATPPTAGGRLARGGRLLRRLARPFQPIHFLRTCWVMRPITALAAAGAVAAPWYIWVGLRTEGQWLESFFLTENVQRALRPMENHHGTPLYYVAAVSIGFFPWSLLLAPMLSDLARRLAKRDAWSAGYLFVSCWAGVWLAVFSAASTKLPSYVTPAYPALALMAGCWLHHWVRGASLAWRAWPPIAVAFLGGVGAVIAVAIPFVAQRYLPGEQWLALVGAIPLAGAGSCLLLLRRQQRAAVGATLVATAAAFSLALFAVAGPRVDRHQSAHLLLNAIDRTFANPEVGALGCLEPSWVFYGGRSIQELTLKPQQPAAADLKLQTGTRHCWRDFPRPDAASFLAGGSERCLITTRRYWDRFCSLAPPDARVLYATPFFLKNDELLLVGRVPPAIGTAAKPLAGSQR